MTDITQLPSDINTEVVITTELPSGVKCATCRQHLPLVEFIHLTGKKTFKNCKICREINTKSIAKTNEKAKEKKRLKWFEENPDKTEEDYKNEFKPKKRGRKLGSAGKHVPKTKIILETILENNPELMEKIDKALNEYKNKTVNNN